MKKKEKISKELLLILGVVAVIGVLILGVELTVKAATDVKHENSIENVINENTEKKIEKVEKAANEDNSKVTNTLKSEAAKESTEEEIQEMPFEENQEEITVTASLEEAEEETREVPNSKY